MNGPFGYERIKDRTVEGGCHFRLHDAADNRVATCYVEGNAQELAALLNASAAWQPITADKPAPLEDVLVSVYYPGEGPVVFAAYRRGTGADDWFVISGTDHERIVGEVYAWAPCLDPAKRPGQQVAA